MRTEQRDEGSYRSEFRYGSMYRCIPLPKGVKEGDVTAVYKNGVLDVKAPVPETGVEATQQKIQISRG